MRNHLSRLLIDSAALLRQENRPDANLAALEAEKYSTLEVNLKQHPAGPLERDLQIALAASDQPIAESIQAANPWLFWEFSALGGRIRPDVANGMMQTELIGPDGIFPSNSTRLGLWIQSPLLDYPTRIHAAEETFFILSGGAHWSRGGSAPYWAGAGCDIHHPSLLEHTTRTGPEPLLALWRWSGDIAIEQYVLKG